MGVNPIARIVLLLFSLKLVDGLELRPINYKRNALYCESEAKKPYFDIDMVVGKTWRIYYTWNVQMEDRCLDMTIKNATSQIANRIYNDMHEYLIVQPVWDAATLYTTLGAAKHELLLFVDQGAAGSFLGVPNVIRDGNITPNRRSVPLLKFFLKLLHEGKYLLMMDCNIGVSSLLSRDRPPARIEIGDIAGSLNLGEGMPSCVSNKNTYE